MTISVESILSRVFELVNDESNANYTIPQALRWLSEAQSWIAGHRADAKSAIETVALVTGTKQSLADGRHHLIRLTRNMGSDGLTPGAIIDGPIDMDIRGRISRNWHADIASSPYSAEDYSYDLETPKTFWVYPALPSGTTHYIECAVGLNPTPVTDPNGNIDIEDRYEGDLVTYVAMRFMSRDSELSPNYARAQSFAAQLERYFGATIEADLAVYPEKKNNPS